MSYLLDSASNRRPESLALQAPVNIKMEPRTMPVLSLGASCELVGMPPLALRRPRRVANGESEQLVAGLDVQLLLDVLPGGLDRLDN